MPVSDTKKVQTMINVVGQQAIEIRAAVATIKAIKTAFTTAGPDVTGTPLEGNTAIVSNAINTLDTAINSAVWTQMIAAIVPSHNNKALD